MAALTGADNGAHQSRKRCDSRNDGKQIDEQENTDRQCERPHRRWWTNLVNELFTASVLSGPAMAQPRTHQASLSILAVILAAANLAAAPTPSESTHYARVARDAFYKCAVMTVPDYDDRISPANIVAKAVAFKCRSWISAMVRNMSQTEGSRLSNEIMRGEEANLLGVVLRNRVLKSSTPPPVAPGARASTRQPVRSAQGRTPPKSAAP